MTEHKEPIPSMIYNASVGGHVTNSQQIIDENENKEQSQINAEVKQILGQGGSVDNRINQAKSDIIGDASSACDTLGEAEALISAETTRAQAAEQGITTTVTSRLDTQDAEIALLNGADVIVVEDHTAVSSPDSQKVYREIGTSSYTDWMYQGGSWKTIATYNPGIDETPTAGSDNLVKSGGVKKIVGEKTITESYSTLSGIIFDGTRFVNSNSTYNSFIIEAVKGQWFNSFVFSNCTVQSFSYYANKPIIGNEATPNYINDFPSIAQNDCYLMVTIKNYTNSASLSYSTKYGIEKEIEDIEKSIEEINYKRNLQIDNFSDKSILCFGDSIMSFFYEDNKNIPNFIASYSQATVYNAAVGGTRWAPRIGEVTFPNQENKSWNCLDLANLVKAWVDNDFTNVDEAVRLLNTYYETSVVGITARNRMVSALKSIRPENVDIIFIMCGGNDLTGNTVIGQPNSSVITELYGAMNNVLDNILDANPSIKVYIYGNIVKWIGYAEGTGEPSNFSDSYTNGNGDKMEDINDAIKNGAKKYKFPFCDMYDNLGWNMKNFSTYFGQNDGSHPYFGRDIIAKKMVSFISSNRLIV